MTNRRNSARQQEEEDEGMTNAQRTKGKGKKNKSAFLAAAAFDLVFSGEASRFSWGLEIVLRAVTHSEARLRGCKKSF